MWPVFSIINHAQLHIVEQFNEENWHWAVLSLHKYPVEEKEERVQAPLMGTSVWQTQAGDYL